MALIIGFLTFLICIALLIGLVKPSIILFWLKKPTRLKILGFWILSMLAMSIFSSLTLSDEERAKSSIEVARNKIEEQDYEGAISELNDVEAGNPLFKNAKFLISKADSLIKIKEIERQNLIQFESEKKKQQETDLRREKLNREITSINKGIDFTSYRGSVTSIQIELALFVLWARHIEEALSHSDKEIQDLGVKLKTKVKKIQRKEFPILRKNYRDVIREILWPENIKTSIYGKGNRTIQFTGGIFANNKNKMEMQSNLSEILTLLRFKRVNYKWYKYDEEYTYYNLDVPSDSEISDFK